MMMILISPINDESLLDASKEENSEKHIALFLLLLFPLESRGLR